MLKRHEIQVLRRAGHTWPEVAAVSGVSVRTVRRVAAEAAVTTVAQAIIDRVLERGRLLRLDGPSVRTLHVNLDEAMKEDSDQRADLARISGKRWPEFPEPTDFDRTVSRAARR